MPLAFEAPMQARRPGHQVLVRGLDLVWRALRTLLWRSLQLVLVAALVFTVLRALPVDPLGMLLPASATEEDVAVLTRELGLDRTLAEQFGIWLQNAVTGDLGTSIQRGLPVTQMVLEALPLTIELLALSLLVGLALGATSGLVAFWYRGRWPERLVQFLNGMSMSIPDFLWGIVLILVVGIGLRWLPFMGAIGPGFDIPRWTGSLLLDSALSGQWAALGSALQHLALPVLALGIGLAAPIARILHGSLVATYAEEYIHAARLRGLSERRLLFWHALPNAVLPTVSLVGVQASTLIGGTLLIESMFGLPGLGTLMLKAIGNHDLPVLQALTLCYACGVQIASLLTDTVLQSLNPRLRRTS